MSGASQMLTSRGPVLVHLVDQYVDGLSDLRGENLLAHLPLHRHEALVAFGFHFLGRLRLETAARCPFHVLIFEAADARSRASRSQSRRKVKSSSVSPGKPTMKVELSPRSGQTARQPLMRSSVFSWFAGRRIAFSTFGRGVLEGDVEIGEDFALRHQRQHLIDMRIGVDIMQPHPGAELRQRFAKLRQPRLHRAAAPLAFGIFDVEAVGACVLADDQELFRRPPATSASASAQHIGGLPACERAAQGRGMMQNEQRLLQPSEIFK